MLFMNTEPAPFQRGEVVVHGGYLFKIVYCWRDMKNVWHAELVLPRESFNSVASLLPVSEIISLKDFVKQKTKELLK